MTKETLRISRQQHQTQKATETLRNSKRGSSSQLAEFQQSEFRRGVDFASDMIKLQYGLGHSKTK